MALTRANIEVILVKRCGSFMAKVSMDSTTVDGTNVDLNDPIRYGITQSEGTVTDYTNVVDADITTVDSTDYDKLIDVAELRLLQNIQGNFTLVDIEIGPRDEALSDLGNVLDKMVARKEKRIQDVYGVGQSTMSVSMFNYDFAEHDIDNIDEAGW